VFVILNFGNAVSLRNIEIFKYYNFFFSYFCNTHVVCSPWAQQAPEKTSLLVETNGHYCSDKQISLNNRDGDGEKAISGDISCSVSATKEGESNYC
jgi:hypothetical protein